MPERLRVRFENGTGGVVYTITGDLVPSTIIGGATQATVEQRKEFPPMLVLDKVRAVTPGAAALFRSNVVGIKFDRIVAVEWLGRRDG